MANVAPEATSDPNILTFATQADLARGRPADACRRAQGAAATPYILRLRAFCFATNGDQAPTDLAIEVARQAGVNDAWLFAALPAIYGDHRGPAARFDTSLDAAVSIAAKLKPGARSLSDSSLLALGVVAREQETPASLRAEAAIETLSAYALGPEIARDALRPALGLNAAKGLPAFVTDLQSVAAAGAPAAKAQALVTLYRKTPTYADFVAAARLTRDDIAALPRDESTAGSALWLARAALAIGDVKLAAVWREGLALGAPSADETAALDVAIAAAGGGGDDAALRQRVELGGANAARDATLFGALGHPPPPRAAALIAATPQAKGYKIASATTVAAMVAASQRGAQGETALYAAQVVGPGAHLIDRASLVSTLQALRAVGLNSLARQVAVEAMIGGGIR